MGMTESIYVQQNYGSDGSNEEDFCILDDVGNAGFGNKPSEASVKILDPSGSVSLFENHFALAKDKANVAIDYLKTPKGFPKFQSRITLKNLSVLWQIFGGEDFSQPIQGIDIWRHDKIDFQKFALKILGIMEQNPLRSCSSTFWEIGNQSSQYKFLNLQFWTFL